MEHTEQVAANGNSTVSTVTGWVPTAAGTYYWVASYGDGNNNSVTSGASDEPVTVDKASPTISTAVTTSEEVVGTGALQDTATLAKGYNETGPITFTLYASDQTTVEHTEQVAANGNSTVSTVTGWVPTAAGTYYWVASYGDGNNNSVTSGASDEPVQVDKATPTFYTTPNPLSGTVGATTVLNDTATLKSGYNPGGTITFYLFAPGVTPDSTYSNNVYTDVVSVSGNTTYDTTTSGINHGGYTLPTSGTIAGTYQWVAIYSGDSNNKGATDSSSNESVPIAKANVSSSFFTTATPNGTITLGTGTQTLSDSVVLSGGHNPTGTITFNLYLGTSTTPVYTDHVTVSGNNTYDTTMGDNPGYKLPTTGTVTGTYKWTASYTGDGNNSSASDPGTSPKEQVTVSPASPSIVTTANPTGTFYAGTTAPPLSDSAVLAGGYNVAAGTPAPTITFTLYLGANSSGTQVYSTTVSVTGDGMYSASTSSETATGLYTWVVTYSGNAFNNTAHDQGGAAEQVTINDQVATNTSATHGFWHNSQGQALLGTYGTALGNWLATTYPNLFGNLHGANGTQVASYFANQVFQYAPSSPSTRQ